MRPRRIQIDTAVNGRLATGDQTLPSGEYVDVFLLEGKAGERVNIRVLGAGFDSYIMVRGPNGFSRDNDDLGGGELDAGLEVRVPRDGEYEIGVTSYEPGETGEYRLSLGSGALPRSSSNRLTVGEPVSGTLTLDDSRLDDGELVDRWRFRPRRGRSYQVEMSSSGFDSYLMVRDEDDLSLDNDDNPNTEDTWTECSHLRLTRHNKLQQINLYHTSTSR